MSTHYREISNALRRMDAASAAVGAAMKEQQAAIVALGESLRACREAKGISLRFVADKLGVSAPFLSDCELGRRKLSADMRAEYHKLLRPLLTMKEAS